MEEMDIKTKISLVLMTYDGNGKLVKFTDKIYGFYNYNNTVNFIRLSDMTIIKQEYTIQYILDKVIVVFARNQNDLSDISSYILDIDTFEVIYDSTYRMEVTNNIIYEGNNISMYQEGYKELIRRVFSLTGEKIGEIKAYSNISIDYIDKTYYYIIRHEKVGEINEYVSIYRINNNIELLWNSNEYDVRCIGDGIYSFSKYGNYEYTKVYNFYEKGLIEA